MKNFALVLSFLVAFAFAQKTQAQDVRIGIMLAPTISFNQAQYTGNADPEPDVSNVGSKLRFNFGPVVDFNIKEEKYFISTGLIYMTKWAGAELANPLGGAPARAEFNLQYLQIPVTAKLYVPDIFEGGHLFFQLGTGLEIKVNEREESDVVNANNAFRPLDVPIIIAAGVEYDLGDNKIFGSFGYQRGLIDAADKDFSGGENVIRIANQLLTLNLGFVF